MACVDYEKSVSLGDPTQRFDASDIFKDIHDYLSQFYVQCHHDVPPLFGINFNYPDKLPNVQIELRFRTIKKDEEKENDV